MMGYNEIPATKEMIYKPPTVAPKAINATLSVKFSNDIFLLESFLKQKGIEYKPEDLELSPFGRGLRIKRAAKNKDE